METRVIDVPTCQGCGLPIIGEPMTHHSALNILFTTHDFECLMAAHEQAVKRLLVTSPATVERWLEATA